jgi:hypothetical protein
MATRIPHSLDAVIIAVQALVDGRPMPVEWSHGPEAEPAPTPPAPVAPPFDEAALMQAVSDLIDAKIKAIPQPQPVIQATEPDHELIARVGQLERANGAVPPGLSENVALVLENVALVLDVQKSQTLRNANLEQRVAALEDIMLRLGEAVHKEQAA